MLVGPLLALPGVLIGFLIKRVAIVIGLSLAYAFSHGYWIIDMIPLAEA